MIEFKSELSEFKFGSLDYWKDEIRSGIRYRSIFGRSKEWTDYKNMYRALWHKGVVPVNIIYATIRSLIPQLYFRNPRIHVSAKKPGMGMHARVLERIDNYLIGEVGVKQQLKSCILDASLCGTGPGIIGYDSEYGFNPYFSIAEEEGFTHRGKKGDIIEYTEEVKPGLPWFLRCNPLDFLVPWGTYRWHEARWYAFRKMRPLRDVLEDPKYENKKELKGNYLSNLDRSSEGVNAPKVPNYEDDSQNRWVELYEIHCKRTGMVMVICLDHDKFLRRDLDFLQVEGLPADVLGFNEDPDYFWWTPDCRLLKSQQAEINDVRTMASRHRKLGLLKVIYDRNLLDKDELTKLLDSDPKAAAGVDTGSTGDIRKAVAFLQSHIPPDLISEARQIREDIREIVGFSRNQMGSFEEASGRRTAHEAEIVRAASLIRIDERRDIISDMLSRVVRKFNQIIFNEWTMPKVIDIVGEDGARYWVRYRGDEIRGEYNFDVDPEETVPENRQTRKQEITEFVQLAMQIPEVDKKYLIESLAHNMGKWLDPNLLFPRAGAGGSPEQPVDLQDLAQVTGGFPGLGGGD